MNTENKILYFKYCLMRKNDSHDIYSAIPRHRVDYSRLIGQAFITEIYNSPKKK